MINVSLLCIIFPLYAPAPVPIIATVAITGKLLWTIVGVASTAITLYYLIDDMIKDLDEQIKALEKEVSKLYNQRRSAWDIFWEWNTKLITAETALETAEDALTAATQAVTDAKTAVSIAKSKHQTTKEDTQLKNNAYNNHVHYCDWCDEDFLCSEGSRLHSEWQQWESKTAEALNAITTAEEAVKVRKSEEGDAMRTVSFAQINRDNWNRWANEQLAIARKLTKDHKAKILELDAKRIERALEEARQLVTEDKITAAKSKIEEIRELVPEA